MDKDVLGFISRFTGGGWRLDVIDCFSKGCCYWFAYILFMRFWHEPYHAELMYDEIENHFGCKVGGSVYDITGDVTEKHRWKPWFSLKDESLRERIRRECIDFTE